MTRRDAQCCAAGQLGGEVTQGHCVAAGRWIRTLATSVETRRNRSTEGGAHGNPCGLGCGSTLTTGPAQAGPVLFSALLSVLLALAPAAAQETAPRPRPLALPGGLTVAPVDVGVEDESGIPTLVLRYLAPEIAPGEGRWTYETALPAMDRLCVEEGLAAEARMGTGARQILIVLMDRVVVRGQPDPDATQFLSLYTRDGDTCIWELF